MKPTNALLDYVAAQMGADTVTFVPKLAAAQWIVAIQDDFTPGPTLLLPDSAMADFDGATPKAITAAVRVPSVNPLTGNRQIIMPPPAGGFTFTTTGTTNLPQTIYGYVMSSDSTTIGTGKLIAAVKFETPILLTASGQAFECEDNTLTINPGAIS